MVGFSNLPPALSPLPLVLKCQPFRSVNQFLLSLFWLFRRGRFFCSDSYRKKFSPDATSLKRSKFVRNGLWEPFRTCKNSVIMACSGHSASKTKREGNSAKVAEQWKTGGAWFESSPSLFHSAASIAPFAISLRFTDWMPGTGCAHH